MWNDKNPFLLKDKNMCSRLPVLVTFHMSKWFSSGTRIDNTSYLVEVFVEKFSAHINAKSKLMEDSSLFYNPSIKPVLLEMCVDTLDLSHYDVCIHSALVHCLER